MEEAEALAEHPRAAFSKTVVTRLIENLPALIKTCQVNLPPQPRQYSEHLAADKKGGIQIVLPILKNLQK